MTAAWEEALDAQLDLITYASGRGKPYIDGWAASFLKQKRWSLVSDDFAERIGNVAFNADCVWVEPDMQTLWENAIDTFEQEPLHPQDMLTGCGFVYLARPFEWRDINNKVTTWRAFAWAETTIEQQIADGKIVKSPGVQLFVFHRCGDADGYDLGDGVIDRQGNFIAYNTHLRRGDLQIDHSVPWLYGVDDQGVLSARLTDDGTFAWENAPPKNVLTGEARQRVIDGQTPKEQTRWAAERAVQCLWRLMQQTIVTRTSERASAPFRKRWKRNDLEAKNVTVIRLRRPRKPTDDEHETRTVEWTHRWLVSGHWRRQWYPSIGAHRQIFISPYVKGPDDMPLEVRKQRVFAFSR